MFAMTETPKIPVYWNLVQWLIQRFSIGETTAAILTLAAGLLSIVIPYLIGSINPAILISTMFYRDDIRTHGSGNAGTTNMLRTFGVKAAVVTLLLDFGKAVIATLLGRFLFGFMGQAIAGFFVGFGHMFPIYYRFRGGKGVACFGIVALVIHPLAFLFILGTFLIVLIGTRFVSLASVMAALIYPMAFRWAAAMTGTEHLNGPNMLMAFLAMCFVIFMHRENLKRIWNRQEAKIDFSKFKKKKKKKEAEEDPPAEDPK
ncbi:MAG: glycerol-3-phosphate 1-O-acyltransferase PlsY [Clostridia bacterium]|nr:glycerol-3-phosphate 1-O-acyltransferase PlsY [Clostridia bacterium]